MGLFQQGLKENKKKKPSDEKYLLGGEVWFVHRGENKKRQQTQNQCLTDCQVQKTKTEHNVYMPLTSMS